MADDKQAAGAEVGARRDPWQDPRIVAGMKTLLARRREVLAGGARPLGWKLALGTEVAMSKLGTTGPLVGFLTDATLLADGAECPVAGWTAPKLEPEIAIHLGAGGEGVAGITTAIELADVDRPPTEVASVLAGDIYHRAVVLDRAATPLPIARPLAARIERDGEEIALVDDCEAAVGKLEELAGWTVAYLRRFGERTAAGEVVICGSVVPLLDIAAGQRLRHEVLGVGALSVSIA